MYYRTHCCTYTLADLPKQENESLLGFIEKYIREFFEGDSKKSEPGLWRNIFTIFSQGISKGYKADINLENEFIFIQELQSNIATFIAFKNHIFNTELTKLLVNENGQLRHWNKYKKEARKLDELLNQKWLKTEYDHAVQSSVMAAKWKDFEQRKHLYPNLKYLTVGDNKVRPQHQLWDGIILPMEHPFWKNHFPPNDWGCRCDVEQTDELINTKDLDVDNFPDLPKMFNINPGIEGRIFDETHPYFNVNKDFYLDIIQSVEKYKKFFPDYLKTDHVRVQVSRWADKVEYQDNLDIAKLLAEKYKLTIKLEPHAIVERVLNPEYLVNGIVADRKAPIGLNLKNLLKKAKKQKCKIVIIDMVNNTHSIQEMEVIIQKMLTKQIREIKEFYLVSKDRKVIKYYK